MVRFLLALTLLATLAMPAGAYDFKGSVHLSFEPDRVVTGIHVPPLQTFEFYLLVDIEPTPGVNYKYRGYTALEAGLFWNEHMYINDIEWLAGSNVINLGNLSSGYFEVLAGLGECVVPSDGIEAVVRFTGLLKNPGETALVGVGAIEQLRSSFDGSYSGWVDCESGMHAFIGSGSRQEIMAFSAVATASSSFSKVKAQYE